MSSRLVLPSLPSSRNTYSSDEIRIRLFDEDSIDSPVRAMPFTPGKWEFPAEAVTPVTKTVVMTTSPNFKKHPVLVLDEDSGLGMDFQEDDIRCFPLSPFLDDEIARDDDSASPNQFQIKRPSGASGRCRSFDVRRSLLQSKRPAPDDSPRFSPVAKRCRQQIESTDSETISEAESAIITAVDRLSSEESLVANGTRSYCLPTIPGKHKDLTCISPYTMAQVLQGDYSDKMDDLTVIDCRYPYEFEGGHIKGAVNMYTRESVQDFLQSRDNSSRRHVLVFHCEFSSERGPKMYRFLRSQDREANKDNYPHLSFPEIYLLEGGYKDFYQSHQVLCEPESYKPMLHEDHSGDLRHFRKKSKSWTAGEKNRKRQGLRF